ncbi:MAG: hypothetical protein XU15_C0002G0314 [candidate division NC10 bacterium CSP1-5]|nr:MAG: hypothetical protein XU15_C0002G0314 [candidate division NC10 bacterium CSP1-5]
MIKRFLKRLIATNKELILSQVLAVKDLMRLLMKNRNTGEKWTRDEIREIRVHLKHIAMLVPALIIFLLPGGSVLLPILAEVLDRRKKIRRPPAVPDKSSPDT